MEPKAVLSFELIRKLSGFIDPKRASEVVELFRDAPVTDKVRSALFSQLPVGSLANVDYSSLHDVQRQFMWHLWQKVGVGVSLQTCVDLSRTMTLEVEVIRAHMKALFDRELLEKDGGNWKTGWKFSGRGRAVVVLMDCRMKEAVKAPEKPAEAAKVEPLRISPSPYANAPRPAMAALPRR